MRKYETIYIVQPDLTEDAIKALTEKVNEVIASQSGSCVRLEDWGMRKLAYPIKKQARGRYFYLNFDGTPALIFELERRLRLDDRILRYQSVKLDREETVAAPVAEDAPVAEAAVEADFETAE